MYGSRLFAIAVWMMLNVTALAVAPFGVLENRKFFLSITEIERFFEEAREGKRELHLHTTTDKAVAYKSAES